MMKPTSPCPRPTYRALIAVAAVSSGLLLAACGGGGGGDSSSPPPPPSGPTPPPPPPPPPAPAPAVSQADATADAANAIQAGNVSTASVDAMFDTTAALAATVASPSPAVRASALRVRPQDGVTTVTDVAVNCAGGGTATITISGVSVTTARNGVFDAGENYTVDYTSCAGAAGMPALTGHVELDITSITGGGQNSATPMTTAATATATNLTIALPAGSVSVNGGATISRTSLTAGSSTTTTSAVAASSLALTTQFNARSGTFTVTNLNGTRSAVTTNGALASSTYAGTHTVAGTANGRTFSFNASTNATVNFDGNGQPTSGDWTAVRSDATIHAVLADGTVVMTVDDGSDGTIDNTWTFPVADLEAAAG